jgi:polysaccharide export outer membrane protein
MQSQVNAVLLSLVLCFSAAAWSQASAEGAATTPLPDRGNIQPADAAEPVARTLSPPAIPLSPGPDEDYRLGPQDLIEVQVYGIEGLKREVRVNSRGAISLPLIGQVTVGGLTSQEAEVLIAAKYEKDYLQEPQVSLFIKEFTSQRITVEGAVNKPGVYPIRGQTTLLQAIAIAGGQGSLSDMNEVMLFRTERGEKKTQRFDVIKIRAGELDDPVLANDDVVVVKRSPGRVAFKDSLFRDVLDAINPLNYLR